MKFLNLKPYTESLPPLQNPLVLQFISITKWWHLICTLSTLNVKPRVASSFPFRQYARPNFNLDTTDWHLLQIHVKCFPHPGKEPLTKCFNFITSWTKSLKFLPYSKRKILVKCFPHPGKEPLTKCFNFITSWTKSLKFLPYSKRKILVPNLKSLFSMVTVSSMNPIKQLSGSVFREKSTPHEKITRIQRCNRVVSNLDFSHSRKEKFIRKSRLKSHPMLFK